MTTVRDLPDRPQEPTPEELAASRDEALDRDTMYFTSRQRIEFSGDQEQVSRSVERRLAIQMPDPLAELRRLAKARDEAAQVWIRSCVERHQQLFPGANDDLSPLVVPCPLS